MVPTGQPVSLYYSEDFVSLDQEVKDLQAPKPEWGSPENSKLPKVEPFEEQMEAVLPWPMCFWTINILLGHTTY